MSYKFEKMEVSKACAAIPEYEYALLYMISEVVLAKTDSIVEINWAECIEARFFSADKELHFFEADGEMQVAEVSDGDGQDEVVKFQDMGKTVLVKEYIDYDEDGQANVVLTRLQGIK